MHKNIEKEEKEAKKTKKLINLVGPCRKCKNRAQVPNAKTPPNCKTSKIILTRRQIAPNSASHPQNPITEKAHPIK